MRRLLTAIVLLAFTQSALAATLTSSVNPNGGPMAPAIVEVDVLVDLGVGNSDFVTAQNWMITEPTTGAIVQFESTPGTPIQDRTTAAGAGALAKDSYWGDFFVSTTLGAGIGGGGAADNFMSLSGGTTIASQVNETETLIHIAAANDVLLSGELAIGTGGSAIVESFNRVLVAPAGIVTVLGDANLDGCTDISDVLEIAANFGDSPARYDQGDLNFDNTVDIADVLEIAANFGVGDCGMLLSGGTSSLAPVPEPAAASMLGLGALLLAAIVRGRRKQAH